MVYRTHYITPSGQQRLRDELRELWKVERPVVTQRVSDAAKEGDRSENAEYIYSKKRLREIDRRIRYLTKRLDILQVIRQLPPNLDKVYFGARVTLIDEQGSKKSYRIVGGDEFDNVEGGISLDSPVARALIGKEVGDEVDVKSPAGITHYEIESVSYKESEREFRELGI